MNLYNLYDIGIHFVSLKTIATPNNKITMKQESLILHHFACIFKNIKGNTIILDN